MVRAYGCTGRVAIDCLIPHVDTVATTAGAGGYYITDQTNNIVRQVCIRGSSVARSHD